MKTSILFSTLIGITFVIKAQNTFPSSGRVGIGTTNPAFSLHIDNPAGGAALAMQRGSKLWRFDVITDRLFLGHTDFSNMVTFKNNGNVGIGTINPARNLEINSSSPIIRLKHSSNGTAAYGYLEFNDVNSRMGFFGYGSGANNSLYIQNDIGGVIIPNGNVGIGTSTPTAKLDVLGDFRSRYVSVSNSQGKTVAFISSGTPSLEYGSFSGRNSNLERKFLISAAGYSFFNGGNVGIGLINPSEKLTVKGKILCEEVEVVLNAAAPDYVFEKYYTGESALKADYVMPTLEEVEIFTKTNYHLPEVPNAKTLNGEGLELKTMSLLLLQKIEELTLYTIEQEKRIKALEAR